MSTSKIKTISSIPIAKFENYIKKIRFPNYKGIEPNSVLTLDFPFTVIVGTNGCGKTSILQALYGCPHGKSTSEHWFSTNLDPIIESTDGPPRFIYEYQPKGLTRSIEAIKTWRKREGNPDYWEPARPRIADNMERFPENLNANEQLHASKDRWNQVRKDVTYISFKAKLSAFDKYMNFGFLTKTKTIKTKQDFIRRRAAILDKAFKSIDLDVSYNSRKSTRKFEIDSSTLAICSKILGKNYAKAVLIEHNYFNNSGISIKFTNGNGNYSEAVAGSGEVVIFDIVHTIKNAPPQSLILLDEPEVSLHPGAQLELRNFIFDEIIKHKHQVVITTHSPSFVQNLPSQAIKLMVPATSSNHFSIINYATPEQAFIKLGSFTKGKRTIIVEDVLAQFLVEKAIKQIAPDLLQNTEIKPYAGGGEKIKQDIICVLCEGDIGNVSVLLDGDQKIHTDLIDQSNIPQSQNNNLKEIFSEYVGVAIKLPLNGGNDPCSSENIITIRKAFDVYNKNFFFFNRKTPEELLLEIFQNDPDVLAVSDIDDHKEKFKKISINAIGDDKSSNILHEQRRLINKISGDEELWVDFVNVVQKIMSNS